MLEPEIFQAQVLNWFDQHGRKTLPWQQAPTPYQVWVSEIMLQQTQVATVIPYYERFLKHFPDVDALAKVPLDDVLHYWSGLGYYARARNLHKTAQQIVAEYKSIFPKGLDDLISLPGIGRSTAGAVASLAMGQSTAILDGNVKRVLCRFFAIEGWSGSAEIQRKLWAIAEGLTPKKCTGNYNQAMMDLGSMVCTRSKPNCHQCPLNTDCLALENDLVATLPTPKKRASLPVRKCYWLVLEEKNSVLLSQRKPTGLWGGLWVFPEFETYDELCIWCVKKGLALEKLNLLDEKRHTFSHYHLDYTPLVYSGSENLKQMSDISESCWYVINSHVKIGLPKPVSELLKQLAG